MWTVYIICQPTSMFSSLFWLIYFTLPSSPFCKGQFLKQLSPVTVANEEHLASMLLRKHNGTFSDFKVNHFLFSSVCLLFSLVKAWLNFSQSFDIHIYIISVLSVCLSVSSYSKSPKFWFSRPLHYKQKEDNKCPREFLVIVYSPTFIQQVGMDLVLQPKHLPILSASKPSKQFSKVKCEREGGNRGQRHTA